LRIFRINGSWQSGGTPVYVRDVAEVLVGEEVRYGTMLKEGYSEAVGGVVMMTAGGNVKEIVTKVKECVAEINARNMIPMASRSCPTSTGHMIMRF
jgi:heavy metal efflux system protein